MPRLTFLVWEFASLGSHVHGGISFAAYAQRKSNLFIKQESFFLFSKLQCSGIFSVLGKLLILLEYNCNKEK